jgi:phosphohistidine phosphatase SixA
MLSKEIKTSCDPAYKSLVRMLSPDRGEIRLRSLSSFRRSVIMSQGIPVSGVPLIYRIICGGAWERSTLHRFILSSLLTCVLVWTAFPIPSTNAQAQTALPEGNDVWALLKKPGYIVLLRHSTAPGSVPESNDMDFKDCSIQRNLDQEGRAQAARIGDEFRKHKIGKARLYSSQYCRAIDTATLTRLGPVSPLPILNQVNLVDLPGMQKAGTEGRNFMKKILAGQLTMLVSHKTNIQAIAGVNLNSGQMAIVHFDPSGDIVVDGKITVP